MNSHEQSGIQVFSIHLPICPLLSMFLPSCPVSPIFQPLLACHLQPPCYHRPATNRQNQTMTHLERLLENETEHTLDTPILLSLAKECGWYASILFCYLMEKQIEQHSIGDRYNLRQGRKWIPMLPEQHILQDLPIFPDVRTIDRAAETLEEAGYITTERTGAFLDRGRTGFDGYYTGRARDRWTWWLVTKNPKDYVKRTRISALEAAAYGMAGAAILAHCHKMKESLGEWKKLSGAELERVLPMDEKTARRQLKALVDIGALERHSKKSKLYRLTDQEITAELVQPTVAKEDDNAPKQVPLPAKRIAPAFKPLLLDFHSGSSVVESMSPPAFLEFTRRFCS